MVKITNKKVNRKETMPDGTVFEITNVETAEYSIEDFDFSLLGLSNERIKKNYTKDDNSKK